jgi:H+/Cl- antiporter ClcA
MAHAAVASLGVVAFAYACDLGGDIFTRLVQAWPWAPVLLLPAGCAAITAATRRFAPGAAGSGIPQVMAALDTSLSPLQRSNLVSPFLSSFKALATAAGLACGLALGREGPSVQIAAGVMLNARRCLRGRGAPSVSGLIAAGSAAGIAAAFNAPLAGAMFAIEQLTRKLVPRRVGVIISAVAVAGLVAVMLDGHANYFGAVQVPRLGAASIFPALLVIVTCGLAGGLFSRLMLASLVPAPGARIGDWRAAHPALFAAGCGLGIAAIGLASDGATYGSGHAYARALLDGGLPVPPVSLILRFVATWLAMCSGVPGGLFTPALALGAGIGHEIAILAGHANAATPLAALGMAAFLAAVTQAPMTAFIIVMEMVDGHAMVPYLMAAAIGARLVARGFARPLYLALAEAQLRRLAIARTIPDGSVEMVEES